MAARKKTTRKKAARKKATRKRAGRSRKHTALLRREEKSEKAIARKLRELRDEFGLARREVSLDTGIPLDSLANYELCRRGISFVRVQVLADYFDVSLDYFAE